MNDEGRSGLVPKNFLGRLVAAPLRMLGIGLLLIVCALLAAVYFAATYNNSTAAVTFFLVLLLSGAALVAGSFVAAVVGSVARSRRAESRGPHTVPGLPTEPAGDTGVKSLPEDYEASNSQPLVRVCRNCSVQSQDQGAYCPSCGEPYMRRSNAFAGDRRRTLSGLSVGLGLAAVALLVITWVFTQHDDPDLAAAHAACLSRAPEVVVTEPSRFKEVFVVADGGDSILIEGSFHEDNAWFLNCLFDEIGISDATRSSLASTTTQMGRQTASDAGVKLEWAAREGPAFTPRLVMTISK